MKSRNVTFTSATPLTDIAIRVVPEVTPYLSVSPDHLSAVPANTTTTMTLFLAATPSQSIGTFSGTIEIRQGNSVIARPFPVTLTVARDTTPPIVSILSPADNSAVSSSAIVVTGTVQDETPVSVTVNGVPAQINNGSFVANEVPLVVGTAEVIVVGTDVVGNTSSRTLHLTNSSSFKPVSIDAFPSSGVAHLQVRFTANPVLPGINLASIGIDFDGDGTTDFTGQQLLDEVTHTYVTEKIYQARVTATDELGNTVTDSIAINVHPMPPLREIWSGMRSALITGDIEGALSYFAPSSRDKYRQVFTALGTNLVTLAQQLPDGNGIQFQSLRDGFAIFHLFRKQSVNGISKLVPHEIQFLISEVGQWAIANF